jgi:hypothetical protein
MTSNSLPNSNQKRSAGFVLTSILVVSAVFLSILGVLFANEAFLNQSVSRRMSQLQARALAEAGLDHALATLRTNGTYTGETLTLPTGSATITITLDDLNRHIRVTGTAAAATVTLAMAALADADAPGGTFTFAIQSDSGGTETANIRNPTVEGNLYTNGNVSILGPGAHVTGNVTAAGTVTNRGTIDGTVTEGAAIRPLPTVDVNYWQAQAQTGTTHTGDYAISGNGTYRLGAPDNIGVITGRLLIPTNATIRITGPLWIQGIGGSALEVSGNPRFEHDPSADGTESVIIANGRLTFSGAARFTADGEDNETLLLMTTYPGSPTPTTTAVAVNANTRFIDTAVFAPNGQISIGRSASGVSVTSLTAQRLFIDSNAHVTYATGLLSADFSGTAGPRGGSYTLDAGSYAELNQ